MQLLAKDDATAAAPGPPGSSEAHNEASSGALFYRYRDADGREVIVDSLARVPASAQGHVERVALEAPPRSVALPTPDALARELHLPSFFAGAGVMLAVGFMLWFAFRRRAQLLLRFALVGGLVVLGAGAYFGWMRRMTGASGSLVETPAALIDGARSAVQKMNERQLEQQRVLRELGAER